MPETTLTAAAGGRTLTVRSPWLVFARARLLGLAAVAVALVVVTFAIVPLIPGDPATVVAGQDATPAQIAQVRRQLGLDQPLWRQFGSYVAGLCHGNLGTSYRSGEPVTQIIAQRLPVTFDIAVGAMLLALLVSVPLGLAVAAACRGGRRRWLDLLFSGGTGVGGAVPEYVLGTILVVLFAVHLQIFPASGSGSWGALVLPIVSVALGAGAALARIVRREAATVLASDYVRTARGRRLPWPRLYARHVLPNLLTSTLTVGGLALAAMLGGAVVVEWVFQIPGLGQEIVTAIANRDYPVIRGEVLVLGLLAALISIAVDALLGLLDPRTLTAGRGRR